MKTSCKNYITSLTLFLLCGIIDAQSYELICPRFSDKYQFPNEITEFERSIKDFIYNNAGVSLPKKKNR